jgi:hypothetical protein
MRKPYLIRTPNFEPTSGGIRVMYGLYGWLLAKGEIAYLNTRIEGDVETVGIYPEIYHGNDMNATKCVRYILQTPGLMSSYGNPSPTTEEYKTNPIYANDKFITFSKIYDTFGNLPVLFLPILNLHLFKDQKRKRTKTCFLVGKGENLNKHPKNSIQLSREFASDQQALADLLNECHTFYCYDRLSAMMEIARLCGCKVKYYGNFPKEELELYEPGMNGVSYQDEEVKLDTDAFRSHYIELGRIFSEKLDIFIEETQKGGRND